MNSRRIVACSERDKPPRATCLDDSGEAGRVLGLYHSPAGLDANTGRIYLSGEGPTLLRIGRKDEVSAKLSSALKKRGKDLVFLHAYVRFDPEYDPLCGDPQFGKLLHETLPPHAKPFDEPAAKFATAPEAGRLAARHPSIPHTKILRSKRSPSTQGGPSWAKSRPASAQLPKSTPSNRQRQRCRFSYV